MIIGTFVVGPVQTNCYIVADDKSKEAVVIDPGSNANAILENIRKNNWNIKAILLTHGHFDHIEAVEKLKKELNIPLYAHENEKIILENSTGNLSNSFTHNKIELHADKFFKDRDKFSFGKITFEVILTPGHTPGGVCYYCKEENILFSGDTLFLLSIGRTDFPYGSYSDLIKSIKEKLFVLPDETKVFSGHGDATTIGREKRENPEVTESIWE